MPRANRGNYSPGKFNQKPPLINSTSFDFRISDEIVDDMLRSAVSELDFGEKSFVENFLRRELEIRNWINRTRLEMAKLACQTNKFKLNVQMFVLRVQMSL